MRKKRWSRERYITSGHTLLELIIVLSMISVIVVITGGAMGLASRSVDSGEKRIESLERLRASLNIIDSQIQSSLPIFLQDSGHGTDNKCIFRGDGASLRFPTAYSLWNAQGGYVEVKYEVISNADGKQSLSISEKMIGMKNENRTKLFDLYDRIYFEYFFKEPAEEKGAWIEQWTDAMGIPARIRLNLVAGTNSLAVIMQVRIGQTANKRPSL